ncbi:LysE family transporter [Comamonadaceae bacterium G21597-S1]|nr:LysE family transporter [Comamonadaceae bacterium G21597-S1]
MPFALDLPVLSAFTLLWLAIVPTPGPNALLVTHVAVTRTPAHLGYAIAGNVTGIAMLAALALIGWAAILQAFPWLRVAVHVFGGLYLMWLGARLVQRARHGEHLAAVPDPGQGTGAANAPELQDTSEDYRRTALLGMATALSNAQAILFITSIFAVTGLLRANAATACAAVIIMVGCNAVYLAALGWLFRRERMRAGYARYRRVLDGTIGSLFLLFGGRLLWRALVR